MNSLPTVEENLLPETSIIVVSDLHLGGTEDPETSARFSRFLDCLQKLDGTTMVRGRNVYPPSTVILLGDILELWDPRDQDRDNVVLDAAVPFLKLERLGCKLIYVTGNHDEDIGDFSHCLKKRGMADTIPLLNNATLSIFRRSYPEKNPCLDVGGVRYKFLHGQQFDPEQITSTISECVGERFDPVDFLEDLANNNAAKRIPSWTNWVLCATFTALLVINGVPSLAPLVPATALAFWGSILVLLLVGSYLFAVPFREEISSWIIATAFFISFLGLVLLLLLGFPWMYPGLFLAILVLNFLFVCIVSLPRLIAYGKRSFYNHFRAKDMTIGEMIKEDVQRPFFINRYIRPEKIAFTADVVIFGHTHVADIHEYTVPDTFRNLPPLAPLKKFLLFNTGSWVRAGAGPKKRSGIFLFGIIDDAKEFLIAKKVLQRTQPLPGSPFAGQPDTFVYIDNSGIRRMEWHDDPGHPDGGTMKEITVYSADTILAKTRVWPGTV